MYRNCGRLGTLQSEKWSRTDTCSPRWRPVTSVPVPGPVRRPHCSPSCPLPWILGGCISWLLHPGSSRPDSLDAYRLVFTYFWQICIYYCTFNVSLITDQDKKNINVLVCLMVEHVQSNYRSTIKQINNNIMYRGQHWLFVCYVLKDCSHLFTTPTKL